MTEEDDLGAALTADIRRKRRRMVGLALAFLVVGALAALAAFTFRDRKVYLIGGSEPVLASVDGTRFRLAAPHGATLSLFPGEHALEGRSATARSAIHVPWAPWTSQVAAPVEEGQCLIIASGGGFYEGGQPDQLYVHEVTHETREVSLPPMTDVVAQHPCRLPGAIQLLDTIVVITTVPCAEAPATDAEARAHVLAAFLTCD